MYRCVRSLAQACRKHILRKLAAAIKRAYEHALLRHCKAVFLSKGYCTTVGQNFVYIGLAITVLCKRAGWIEKLTDNKELSFTKLTVNSNYLFCLARQIWLGCFWQKDMVSYSRTLFRCFEIWNKDRFRVIDFWKRRRLRWILSKCQWICHRHG